MPIQATHMLIAGALTFVVFMRKRNDWADGGGMSRYVESVREVTGFDGERVLSSEVFAPGPQGRAVPYAPIACMPDLELHGLALPAGAWSR